MSNESKVMHEGVKCIRETNTCEGTGQSQLLPLLRQPWQTIKIVFQSVPCELPDETQQAKNYENEGQDQVGNVWCPCSSGLQIRRVSPDAHARSAEKATSADDISPGRALFRSYVRHQYS